MVLVVISHKMVMARLAHLMVQVVLTQLLVISQTECIQVSLALVIFLVEFFESQYFGFSNFSFLETNILEE